MCQQFFIQLFTRDKKSNFAFSSAKALVGTVKKFRFFRNQNVITFVGYALDVTPSGITNLIADFGMNTFWCDN
jgi:hypothetical protein